MTAPMWAIARCSARTARQPGQGRSRFLGFEHAAGPPVHHQDAIAFAADHREIADSDAQTRAEIERAAVLHDPSRLRELTINLLAGLVLRSGHAGKVAERAMTCAAPA